MLCLEKGWIEGNNLMIHLKKKEYISLFVHYILTLHQN
jgi:hypothetical protein